TKTVRRALADADRRPRQPYQERDGQSWSWLGWRGRRALRLSLAQAGIPLSVREPISVGVRVGVSGAKSGGDGWESNPPGTPQQRPADGFEDRGGHQPPNIPFGVSVAPC